MPNEPNISFFSVLSVCLGMLLARLPEVILPINTLLFETADVYLFDFWFFRFIIIITLICSVLKLTFVFLVFPSLGIGFVALVFVFSLVHRTTQADVGIHQWHRFPLLFVSYPGGGQALSKYAQVVGTPPLSLKKKSNPDP